MVPLIEKGLNPAPRCNRTDFMLLAGLSLLALLVRLPGLDRGLWVDEILSWLNNIRLPAGEIMRNFSLNNHILYSLCAHFSTAWFGESVWALRLPAVVFGVGMVPAIYYLGRQLAPRSEAFLAALFLTLNYQFVWFSQSARGYTGLAFGAVLATILFIKLITTTKPSAKLFSAYGVVMALTIWIHLTAVVILLVHGVIWLVLTFTALRRGTPAAAAPARTALLMAGLFCLVLYAPIFEAVSMSFDRVIYSSAGLGEGGVNAVRFISNPGGIRWVLGEFNKGLNYSFPGGWSFLLVLLLTLVSGSISYGRQGFGAIGILLFPFLATGLLIAVFAQFFLPRFLFSSIPFLMLIAVRGGFVLAALFLSFLSRQQVLAIGVLFALVSASQIPAAWKPKQDFAAVVAFMGEHRHAGDGLICLGFTSVPLKSYLGMDCLRPASVSDLERIEKRFARIWLIYSLPEFIYFKNPFLWRGLEKRMQPPAEYRVVRKFPGTLSGGDIVVLFRQQRPRGDGNDP